MKKNILILTSLLCTGLLVSCGGDITSTTSGNTTTEQTSPSISTSNTAKKHNYYLEKVTVDGYTENNDYSYSYIIATDDDTFKANSISLLLNDEVVNTSKKIEEQKFNISSYYGFALKSSFDSKEKNYFYNQVKINDLTFKLERDIMVFSSTHMGKLDENDDPVGHQYQFSLTYVNNVTDGIIFQLFFQNLERGVEYKGQGLKFQCNFYEEEYDSFIPMQFWLYDALKLNDYGISRVFNDAKSFLSKTMLIRYYYYAPIKEGSFYSVGKIQTFYYNELFIPSAGAKFISTNYLTNI